LGGYENRILLGDSDAYAALPMLQKRSGCGAIIGGEEYSYKQKEVMRDEVQVPETFKPQPLFKLA